MPSIFRDFKKLALMNKFLFFIVTLFLWCCAPTQTTPIVHKGYALGTSYSVQYAPIKHSYEKVQKGLDSIFEVLNKSLSTYVPDSDISKINRGDSLLVVDEHFENVYAMASEVWKKTNGYFDPTVGALVNAYGFGPDTDYTPISESQRDEILTYTGWNKTRITSKKTVLKTHPQLYFDFNALAKGYVVDQLAYYLQQLGSENHLVEIGGELVAQGKSPRSQKWWTIAIENPNREEEKTLIKTLALQDKAIATSGNYRKFKIEEATGKRLVHSINPKTGNPFPTEVLSASVIAPTCMQADAYATALMVMPLEESKALIEREPHVEAYWIVETKTGAVEEVFSSGFPRE